MSWNQDHVVLLAPNEIAKVLKLGLVYNDLIIDFLPYFLKDPEGGPHY